MGWTSDNLVLWFDLQKEKSQAVNAQKKFVEIVVGCYNKTVKIVITAENL